MLLMGTLRLWGLLLAACLATLAAAKEGTHPSWAIRLLERFDLSPELKGAKEVAQAVEEIPPRPLQVFEYGPKTKEEYRRNKAKYKYQHVCVMNEEGGATWHTRRTPWLWKGGRPPFHVRIVRPNFVGMLYFLMNNGKVRVEWVEEEEEVGGGRTRKVMRHKIVPQ